MSGQKTKSYVGIGEAEIKLLEKPWTREQLDNWFEYAKRIFMSEYDKAVEKAFKDGYNKALDDAIAEVDDYYYNPMIEKLKK